MIGIFIFYEYPAFKVFFNYNNKEKLIIAI